MQFVFASDKNNGYGLLYYDCKQMEAEHVREKIIIPSEEDLDVFAFTSFGTNNNQPLFYKLKKDVNYPRGAYYIHGVFHNADKDYYVNGDYKNDLFGKFIFQEDLEALRSVEGKTAEYTFAEDLRIKNASIDIDVDLVANIVEHIYNEDNITLCIKDEMYSVDIGRVIMGKIFDYLPRSLKKACTFIIGSSSETTQRNFKVTIIPKSKLKKTSGIVIDMHGDSELKKTPIYDMIKAIVDLNQEDRERVFSAYELLFNGYNSYYQLKKFSVFWDAYTGDDETLWKIVDSYIDNLEDPSLNDIPSFAHQRLISLYKSKYESTNAIFVNSIYELLDVNGLCKKFDMELKRLYLYDESDCSILDLLWNKANHLKLDNAAIKFYNEFTSKHQVIKIDEDAGYIKMLEKALQVACFEALKSRVNGINTHLNNIKNIIESIKKEYQDGFSQAASKTVEDYIRGMIEVDVLKLKDLHFSCDKDVEDLISKVVEECNETYYKKEHQKQGFIEKHSITNLNSIVKGIIDNKESDDGSLNRFVEEFGYYPDIIAVILSSYFSTFNRELSMKKLAFLEKMGKGRVYTIAKQVANSDPIMAIYITALYEDMSIVALAFHYFLENYQDAINRADETHFKNLLAIIQGIISSRLLDNEIAYADSILDCERKLEALKVSGNCKALLKAMCSVVRGEERHKGKTHGLFGR